MKDTSITDKLYIDIEKKIDRCKTKATAYTVLFYFIRITLILLAAAITLVTAYKKAFNIDFGELVLWLGAITTVLTATDTLYQTDSKRNTYKTMLHDYRVLRTDFVYHYNGYSLTPEKKQLIYEESKRIDSLGRELIGTDD
jgi:steroid 5-alpha reductase family enzyme